MGGLFPHRVRYGEVEPRRLALTSAVTFKGKRWTVRRTKIDLIYTVTALTRSFIRISLD